MRYEKDPMGAAIFVRYSKHSSLSFASIQRTFAANSRSVEQTEQTFNKTFAVFAGLNGPLVLRALVTPRPFSSQTSMFGDNSRGVPNGLRVVLLNTAHNRMLPNVTTCKCPSLRVTARNSPELPRMSGKYTCPGQFSWELQKGGQLYTFSFVQWTNDV